MNEKDRLILEEVRELAQEIRLKADKVMTLAERAVEAGVSAITRVEQVEHRMTALELKLGGHRG